MIRNLRTRLVLLLTLVLAGAGSVWADSYKLVKSASELKQGDVILITSATSGSDGYAMGAQSGNNCPAKSVTIANETISDKGDAQEITLESVNDKRYFTFKVGDQYLYAANSQSGKNNYLKTKDSGVYWSIEIDATKSTATIKDQESSCNSRNWLRFNSTNSPKIFSCYASGQSDVYVFKKEANLQETTITVTGGTEQTIDRTKDEEELTLEATASSGATVTFSLVSSTLADGDYEFDEAEAYLLVSGTKSGKVVVRASCAATTTHDATSVDITVTVIGEKEDATIVVNESETLAWGSTLTIDDSMIEGGDITVTSSNESVATVSGLVVTAQAVGTTTITVATAENDEYKAGSETFTLTVTAPTPSATAPVSTTTTLFNETFDKSDGTGGRDDKFSDNVGTSSLKDKTDEDWATIGSNGASKCVKLGSGSSAGSIKTREIALTGEGTLTFAAAGWGDSKTNTLTITATGGTIDGEGSVSITLTNGEWKEDYSYVVNGTAGKLQLEFSMKRGFLDEIKVVQGSDATAPKVTLSDNGYASYCCEYPLDFSVADDNFAAWYVSGVSGTEVTFSKIEGKIGGGVPFVLYGTPGHECQLTYADSDETLAGNMLEGTLAPTYVATEADGKVNYGLSGGRFVKINSGVVPQNKAYLPVPQGGLSRLNIVFDGVVTAISDATSAEPKTADATFDLQGRRVHAAAAKRGLYIVNGKKIVK